MKYLGMVIDDLALEYGTERKNGEYISRAGRYYIEGMLVSDEYFSEYSRRKDG